MSIEPLQLDGIDVLMADVPSSIMRTLSVIADTMENHWDESKNWNSTLAGHLLHQYQLEDIPELDSFVLELASMYDQHHRLSSSFSKVFTKKVKLSADRSWINFQSPTEYNPVHGHSGLISWVIWVKIPYSRYEEAKCFPDRKVEDVLNGDFQFIYTNHLGRITTSQLALDKSYEGKIVLFPSTMMHAVYPFYTVDAYRVSVAGNIYVEEHNG